MELTKQFCVKIRGPIWLEPGYLVNIYKHIYCFLTVSYLLSTYT